MSILIILLDIDTFARLPLMRFPVIDLCGGEVCAASNF